MLQESTVKPHTGITRLSLILDLSPNTIRKMCKEGRFRAAKLDGKLIIEDASVNEYLEKAQMSMPSASTSEQDGLGANAAAPPDFRSRLAPHRGALPRNAMPHSGAPTNR